MIRRTIRAALAFLEGPPPEIVAAGAVVMVVFLLMGWG
jgi:hypothetical protein